jgi:hypothetical protein
MEDYVGANQYPLATAVLIAAGIVSLTGLSRLFVGVHSLMDLTGGLLIGLAIFHAYTFIDTWMDEFVTLYAGALYFPTILIVVLLLVQSVWFFVCCGF